jgi:aryl-alcohol dehydrogenase
VTGSGAHFAFDTTGVPGVAAQALHGLRARGTAVYLAAPPAGSAFQLEARVFVGSGKTIRGVVQGDAIPSEFIPRIIAFYRAGVLPPRNS